VVSRISAYQAVLLLITAVVPTAILSLPPLLTEIAREDASIITVISPLLMMTSGIYYIPLLKAMGRTDMITFAKKGLGTIVGLGLGLSIAGGYTLLNGLVIRQLSEVMAIAYLPETPLWFINATLIAISSYAVFLGVETIARTTEIAFPFFIGFFLLVILFLIPDMNLSYLRPLFSQGMGNFVCCLLWGRFFFPKRPFLSLSSIAPHLFQ